MSDMTPEQMNKRLDRMQTQMRPMLARFLDTTRVKIAQTATQKYMKDGGFTSPPFPPRQTRSGPLRILSGRLSRSLTGSRSVGADGSTENISEISTTKAGIKYRYGTKTPYANVHEQGFSGLVRVPTHKRNITQAFGKPIDPKTVTVREHRRSMFIPARPFLGPATDDNLQWMEDELAEQTQQMMNEVLDG